MGLPTLVLPKTEILATSPVSALGEIRTSFGLSLANLELALPQGGPSLPGGQEASAMGLKLPDIFAFFKGPAAQNAPRDKIQNNPKVETPKSVFNYR